MTLGIVSRGIIDRTGWPAGPWDDEPDELMWELPTGQRCLMLRNRLGNWCGYASVAKDHPWHGLHYAARIDGLNPDDRHDHTADRPESVIDVHGGLTYAGERCDDSVWFFGFDCAHLYDFVPGLHWLSKGVLAASGTYRDAAYVQAETNRLAEQLAEVKP